MADIAQGLPDLDIQRPLMPTPTPVLHSSGKVIPVSVNYFPHRKCNYGTLDALHRVRHH
jgi:hypothetical protein